MVPILDALYPVLAQWKLRTGGEGRVIPSMRSEGVRISKRIPGKHLRATLKRLGLTRPGLGWYEATRHTFASQWVLEGGSIEVLKEILGHYSVVVTERYTHLRPDLFADRERSTIPLALSPAAAPLRAKLGRVWAAGPPRRRGVIHESGGMAMTPEEIAREVRARVEWGHPPSRIRSELLRTGVDAAMLDAMLRRHLKATNAEYRWKGLFGLLAAAALFWGAYQVGSPLLPRKPSEVDEVAEIDDDHALPGRTKAWRPALAFGLLAVGAVTFAIGAHRVISGRRGDR